jgi:hypothetical protein
MGAKRSNALPKAVGLYYRYQFLNPLLGALLGCVLVAAWFRGESSTSSNTFATQEETIGRELLQAG